MASKNPLYPSTLLRKGARPSTRSSGDREYAEKKRKEVINVDTNVTIDTPSKLMSFYIGCEPGEWIKGSLISGVFCHLSPLPFQAVSFCDDDAHRIWMNDLHKYHKAESLKLMGPEKLTEKISVLIPWKHRNAYLNSSIVTLEKTIATNTFLDSMPSSARADEPHR